VTKQKVPSFKNKENQFIDFRPIATKMKNHAFSFFCQQPEALRRLLSMA